MQAKHKDDDDEEEEEAILGSDDDEQEDPRDYCKGVYCLFSVLACHIYIYIPGY